MRIVQRIGLLKTNPDDRPLTEVKIVKAKIVEAEDLDDYSLEESDIDQRVMSRYQIIEE